MFRQVAVPVAILALALLLRLLGIWHDYPYSYYPDEAHFVKRALSFGSFDFNPHWFHKPAFLMYLLFFEYGIVFALGKLMGVWGSVQDFAVQFVKDPGVFYLVGRVTVTAFGVASVWLVYHIGTRHFGRYAGIVGALLLALSFGHVSAGQDIKADVPAMFFGLASMALVLRYFDGREFKWLMWASVLAGVGAATKVYPSVMLLPIFMALAWGMYQHERHNAGRLMGRLALLGLALLATFVAAYFICAPYSFLDPLGREATFSWFNRVLRMLQVLAGQPVAERPNDFIEQGLGRGEAVIVYFQQLFINAGLGPVIGALGLIGLPWLLRGDKMKGAVLLSYPLVFVSISLFILPGYSEVRHQLPIYPYIALGGGVFVAWAFARFGGQQRILSALLALVLLIPTYQIVQYGLFISKQNTRNLAKAWIETNIPSGIRLLVDENGPPLLASAESLQVALEKAKASDPSGQFTAHYDTYLQYQILAAKDAVSYDLVELRFPWWREAETAPGVHYLDSEYDRDAGNPLRPVGVKTYDAYLDDGIRYVIVQSERYQPFITPSTHRYKYFPSFRKFYIELFQRGKLIKVFDPAGERVGPIVKIYELQS
jgi:4-amino-4-deoxy-L-arabinose transferase-like glycosyltransferase